MTFNVKAFPAIPSISNQVFPFLSMAISSPYSSVPHSCRQPRNHYDEFLQLADISFPLVYLYLDSSIFPFLNLCREPSLNLPGSSAYASFPALSISLTHACAFSRPKNFYQLVSTPSSNYYFPSKSKLLQREALIHSLSSLLILNPRVNNPCIYCPSKRLICEQLSPNC